MRKKPKFLFDFSNCKSGKVSGLKTPVSTRAELFWLCVYRLKDHFKTILKYFEESEVAPRNPRHSALGWQRYVYR